MKESTYSSRLSLLKWVIVLLAAALLIGWLLKTPPGLLGKADAVGYAVCHRIDLRSFHIGERPLPLCARCSGMYLGALLGLTYQAIISRRRGGLPPRWLAWLFAGLALAFVIDGLNSFLSFFPEAPQLYTPQNWSRLLTGTGMGLAIAAYLYPAFNQSVWRRWDPRPALQYPRQFIILVLLALVLDALLLSEITAILYLLALLSALGVLAILTMTYTVLGLMLLRRENRIENVVQLVIPLTGGFCLAIGQIILLDILRFWLTGTWDGFHLG